MKTQFSLIKSRDLLKMWEVHGIWKKDIFSLNDELERAESVEGLVLVNMFLRYMEKNVTDPCWWLSIQWE